MNRIIFKFIVFFIILLITSSCYVRHDKKYFFNRKKLGHYKIGSNYTVNGITYYPQHYDNFEEIGIASWYGDKDCKSKTTANGDTYSSKLMTAAHKTLPLPCFVLVTNLENGRKLIVKVNDRGPFVKGRIIDLTEGAAKVLGFHDKGLTTVKIQYLKGKTKDLILNTSHYRKQYEKIMSEYNSKRKNTNSGNSSKKYISKFKDSKSAKNAVSCLRKKGVKNVVFYFKNGKYYVQVG